MIMQDLVNGDLYWLDEDQDYNDLLRRGYLPNLSIVAVARPTKNHLWDAGPGVWFIPPVGFIKRFLDFFIRGYKNVLKLLGIAQ